MTRCIDEKLGQLITLYELNQLGEKERLRFEEHLLECDFCLQELKGMNAIIFTLRENGAAILEELQGEGLGFDSQKQEWLNLARAERFKKTNLALLWIRISDIIKGWGRPKELIPAAIVAMILILLLILPPVPRPENPYTSLLAFDKIPYRQMQLRTVPAAEGQQWFEAGMDEYLHDNFKGAISQLKRAVKNSPGDGTWWLYLGVSYYLDHQAQPAIEALTEADRLTEYSLKNRAQWYLAQAYLLAGQAEAAIPLLDSLAHRMMEYAPEADSLLMKVKSVAEKD